MTTTPRKYRKKPVVVEAMRYDGTPESNEAVIAWANDSTRPASAYLAGVATPDGWQQSVSINTLEGTMRATAGDYIIKGVKGEFYPCKPDVFHATYESADAPAAEPELLRLRAAVAQVLKSAPSREPTYPEDANDYELEDYGAARRHYWLADSVREALGDNTDYQEPPK